MPISQLSHDQLAAALRAGDNLRLPQLSEAGKHNADLCATLLRNGAALPLWAIAE